MTLRIDGERGHAATATGDGMVDACYKVIASSPASTRSSSATPSRRSPAAPTRRARSSCLVTDDGVTVTGQGSHTDIIQASALAYVNALNKLATRRAPPCRQVRSGR